MIKKLKLLGTALLLSFFSNSAASENNSLEMQLKAAYLVNVIKFVTWPHDNNEIVLCIEDSSPISKLVLSQDGRLIGSNKLLRIKGDWQSFEQCDAFYWDTSLIGETLYKTINVQKNHLLTISDQKNALESGFAVQFYTRNLKLRFAINEDIIKQANYNVSSKLMRLSRQVD